jgi:hypothetical protein
MPTRVAINGFGRQEWGYATHLVELAERVLVPAPSPAVAGRS